MSFISMIVLSPFSPYVHVTSQHTHASGILSHLLRCQELDNSALSAEPSDTWFPTHCIRTAMTTWVLSVMNCRMPLVISCKMTRMTNAYRVNATCAVLLQLHGTQAKHMRFSIRPKSSEILTTYVHALKLLDLGWCKYGTLLDLLLVSPNPYTGPLMIGLYLLLVV